jgi:hypothetical protein
MGMLKQKRQDDFNDQMGASSFDIKARSHLPTGTETTNIFNKLPQWWDLNWFYPTYNWTATPNCQSTGSILHTIELQHQIANQLVLSHIQLNCNTKLPINWFYPTYNWTATPNCQSIQHHYIMYKECEDKRSFLQDYKMWPSTHVVHPFYYVLQHGSCHRMSRHPGFQYDKATVLRDTIKGTLESVG